MDRNDCQKSEIKIRFMFLPFHRVILMANFHRYQISQHAVAGHRAKTPLGGRCRTRMSTLGYIRPGRTRACKVPHLQMVWVWVKIRWLNTTSVYGETWLKVQPQLRFESMICPLSRIDGYLRPAWLRYW